MVVNQAFEEQDTDQPRIIHALDQEESDSEDGEHKQGTDEDEGRERFMMNKTPS